jgi:hypothetical protein
MSTALLQLETSAQNVHENLNSIVDYQTHHRLREAQVSDSLLFPQWISGVDFLNLRSEYFGRNFSLQP